MLRHQGRDAVHAQLGRFFYQPIHAVIGGHHHCQVHLVECFSLNGLVRTNNYPHILSAHMFNNSVKLSARTIEQRDRLARLHTQHLHMAGSSRGQRDGSACM